jgi:DNA repair protein RadA/Sms
MKRITTRFVCSECGYESSKWLGRCPGCSNWNSLIEETVNQVKNSTLSAINYPVSLQEITQDALQRMPGGPCTSVL